jgi:hypothetical protein
MTCSNQMTIGLGLFGTWSVRIKGRWQTCHDASETWRFSGGSAVPGRRSGSGQLDGQSGLSSEVAFDGFGVRLSGLFGLDLGKMLPELSVSVPRRAPQAQANWRTTYCDGEYRIGRGVESGGVFLFKKK